MSHLNTEIRQLVLQRAGNCCEYCLLSQDDDVVSFHIDYVYAEKHGGRAEADNLCLICPACNSFRSSNIASIDQTTKSITALFHPRRQKWADHFRLDGVMIEPLTAEGNTTVFLLRLNRGDRVSERIASLQVGNYPCRTNAGGT